MADLLAGLASKEDATRKMAAFKLQTLTNDPAFAEQFCAQGGLGKLRDLLLDSSGNTLAYGLASFARLLEVDHGWEGVNARVIQKVRISIQMYFLTPIQAYNNVFRLSSWWYVNRLLTF